MITFYYKIWLKDKQEFLADSIHTYEFNNKDSAKAFIDVYELKNVEIIAVCQKR